MVKVVHDFGASGLGKAATDMAMLLAFKIKAIPK